MIFIQTNFDKSDPVITFAYALAYLHERFLYRLCKYRPTVFCWAHKVVKKIAHILRSMHIDTFRHPESAPRPCFFSIIVSFHGRGQVAASRGECIPKSFKDPVHELSLHHRIRRHLCSVSGISSSPPLIRRFRRENRGAGNMETRSLSTPFPRKKHLTNPFRRRRIMRCSHCRTNALFPADCLKTRRNSACICSGYSA